MRLSDNPDNKLCGDCCSPNPDWASINLLVVICQSCAGTRHVWELLIHIVAGVEMGNGSICRCCMSPGQHRALGTKLSKVRSLKMDNKVWTAPLIQVSRCNHALNSGRYNYRSTSVVSFGILPFQLFVTYGNRLSNQVWAPAVPAAEQLHSDSSDEERSKFIQAKYSRGRYRHVHALAYSQSLMDQVCQLSKCRSQ